MSLKVLAKKSQNTNVGIQLQKLVEERKEENENIKLEILNDDNEDCCQEDRKLF